MNSSGKSVCSPEEQSLIRALALSHVKQDGTPNIALISRETGVGRVAVRRIIATPSRDETLDRVQFPSFVTDGDEEEPIHEIIDRMARRFETAKKVNDAKKWFPIKINEQKPIGLLNVGDAHVDDNGCNWPVLKRHAEICSSTPGMYAVNIGDSGNFWGGRLIRKYADQDTSVHTARRLVEWLLVGSGIPWLVWLFGNHEPMGDAQPLIREMNKRHGTNCVPMFDWEARFKLVFPNGHEFKINAAHDFPGNSMWNPIHGAVKAAKFGNDVDLLVHGHKHNWAISQWEQPEQGNTPLMIRVRGYKHMDSYAQRIGKYEQDEGQSILVVFNPDAKTRAGKMVPFPDIEEGAEYLTYLRNRAG